METETSLTEASRAGGLAYAQMKQQTDNPFMPGTPLNWAWDFGWRESEVMACDRAKSRDSKVSRRN